MEWINTSAAPAPKGAYSQGCVHNGIVYVAGQLSLLPRILRDNCVRPFSMSSPWWRRAEATWPTCFGSMSTSLMRGSSPCSMKYTHSTSPSPIPPGRRVW